MVIFLPLEKRPEKHLEPGEVRLTFHKRVLDLSDTQRFLSFLETAAKSIMPVITAVFNLFLDYREIWAEDKDKQIQVSHKCLINILNFSLMNVL